METSFKNVIALAGVSAAIFGAVAPAMASTATVTTTLNVADIQAGLYGFTGGAQGSPPFTPPFSVELSAGDTFDFTINFEPGQKITINNLSFIWAFSYTQFDSGTSVTGTGSLSFLDSNGAALYTSNIKTDTEGAYHFGQNFNDSDFNSLPASVTFSGLHYVGTVDSYSDPVVLVRTYNKPALFFNADSYTAMPVPESETYAMLIAGLGLLGFTASRRKQKLPG